MIQRFTVSLLMLVALRIGIVEAGQACPAGTVPTLERVNTVVITTDNRIDIVGVPEWGACVPSRQR